MSRELTGGLKEFLSSGRGANFASWCVLTLPEVPGSPSAQITGKAYHLATRNVTINNVPYTPSLRDIGQIKRSVSRAAEQITVSIQNVDTIFGSLLLKDINVLHGATVRVGRYWHDPASGARWSRQMFVGVVDGASGDEQNVNLRCLSDYYAVRAVGGGRAVELQCQAVFNSPAVRATGSGMGAACGYTGTDITCDKLKATCNTKSNLFRFQGFVNIESAAPVSGTTNQPAPSYSLVLESDGSPVATARQLKFANSQVSTTGDVTTVTPELSDGFFVDSAPYNAVGDGVTDDTAAIQAAIDAAEAVKGTVHLGHKTYLHTGLTMEGKVTLRGAAEGASVLYSTSNAVIVDMSADANFLGGTLENLTVRGSVSAGSSQIGVKVDDGTYGYRFAVRNVQIENCGDHGLYVKRAFSSTFENIFVTNCADYPFLYDGANMPGNYFIECYAGDLRSGAEIAFHVISGTMNLYSCNGINGGAGLAKSIWAEVGTATAGARLELVDCNIESFGLRGIRARHSSVVNLLGNTSFAAHGVSDAVTITIASPGVVTYNSHPFVNGDSLAFATTGALPTGLTAGTRYYVVNKAANTFEVAATRGGAAINTSGSQSGVHTLTKYAKAIEYTLENDGVDFFAPYLTRGYIDDTVDFANGAAAFADGYPVHSNGFLPLQVRGQGALQGGSPNAKLTSFFNTATSTAMPISREDGNVAVQVVTGNFDFSQPGVDYIELNHSAAITSGNGKLPWPGWYARAQRPLYIKDRSTAGCATNNVTLTSNGGATINGAGSFVMNITGQSLLLLPDGAGDWRVVSSWPASDQYVGQNYYLDSYSSSGSGANAITRRRHRGSAASPAAVQSGDVFDYEIWEGQYDTTVGHRHQSAFDVVSATENFDATHGGVKREWTAAPNASTNGFAEGFRLDPTNNSFEPIAAAGLDLGSDSYPWNNAKLRNAAPALARMFRQTAKVTVGNNAAETTLLSGAGTLVIDANSVNIGTTFDIEAWGYGAKTSSTTRWRLKLGSTALCDSTALGWAPTGTRMWHFQGTVTIYTTGATGTLSAEGIYRLFDTATTQTIQECLNTGTATFDFTTTNTFDFTIQHGATGAGNTASCTNFTITRSL